MKLRKGKTKSLLESSIDAALLAVEVYNKPRTTFRSPMSQERCRLSEIRKGVLFLSSYLIILPPRGKGKF